jgi:hypothetical protein
LSKERNQSLLSIKKNDSSKDIYRNISFIIFAVLIVSVTLAFWKPFDNAFDFVKASLLRFTGGLFITSCSVYFLFGKNINRKTPSIPVDKNADLTMLIFIAAAALSAMYSVNPILSFWGNYEIQIGFITYLNLAFIYLFLPAILNTEAKFRLTFIIMEYLALIIAVISLIEYFGINPFDLKPPDFMRPVTPVGHPVFTAGFLLIIFPFSAVNISGKRSLTLRIIFPVIIFAGIISTQTRSAYAALVMQIILFSVIYPFVFRGKREKEKKKYLIYSGVFLLVLILIIFILVLTFPENPFIKRLTSITTITQLPRWFLWSDSIKMFADYPVTGTGISAFSNVFENYASYELKYTEIKAFFVNAHSNIINTFCTMGLIGGAAYLLVLFQAMRISIKNTFLNDSNTKSFFYASSCSIAGYIIFGIADFDDITVLFFFFAILSLIKTKNLEIKYISGKSKIFSINGKTKLIVCIVLTAFSIFSIYRTYFETSAQIFYSAGTVKYKNGDITGYLTDMNNVLELNPGESYYRFKSAYDLLVYSSGLDKNSSSLKRNLLERANNEVTAAMENYRSRLECLALKSLISLEQGNEEEGFRIKEEIFKTDTTQFPYRTNLAVYYLNRGNDSAAIYEINSILNWDFENVRVLTLKVYWLERKGHFDEVIAICRKILEIEPSNKFAGQTLERLEKR